MRAPRRTKLPAKQRNSPGSGPAGPENFGYFPSLESSPPAGGTSPKRRNRGFAASAASFFLSDQKETKESPGDVAFGKDLRLAPWSFMSHFPPDPRFYGGARGMRKQLRPARKPHERCLCLLTAVLLNEPDRLLLQGTMRLRGATYTVGSGRRAGEADSSCQGEMSRRDRGGRDHPPLHPVRIVCVGADVLIGPQVCTRCAPLRMERTSVWHMRAAT